MSKNVSSFSDGTGEDGNSSRECEPQRHNVASPPYSEKGTVEAELEKKAKMLTNWCDDEDVTTEEFLVTLEDALLAVKKAREEERQKTAKEIFSWFALCNQTEFHDDTELIINWDIPKKEYQEFQTRFLVGQVKKK